MGVRKNGPTGDSPDGPDPPLYPEDKKPEPVTEAELKDQLKKRKLQ